jgi:hypothetical protein
MRGFFLYLLMPDPGPVGVNVEPLGDELGPVVRAPRIACKRDHGDRP